MPAGHTANIERKSVAELPRSSSSGAGTVEPRRGSSVHTDTKMFRVSRTFITYIAAPSPARALEMVREAPELWDTDILEHSELVTDDQNLTGDSQ